MNANHYSANLEAPVTVGHLETGDVFLTRDGRLYQFAGERPYDIDYSTVSLWCRDLRTGGRINVQFRWQVDLVQVVGHADPQITTEGIWKRIPALAEFE
jgi:hypothetical protein